MSPQKASFLRAVNDEVTFVKWTQDGMRITGTIDMSERKPNNDIETTLIAFDGVLSGEGVNMNLKSSWTARGGDKAVKREIAGTLKGDTLTLLLSNELEPVQFRRATPEEHAEATRKLEMRVKLNKGAH
jgi:hypothetical protein